MALTDDPFAELSVEDGHQSTRIDRMLRELARAPEPQRMPGLQAGTVIAGRYRLDDVLGAGGMGRVWRCRDVIDGDDKALKELAASGSDVRFKREFYTMARLAHPNTVRVFDCGVSPTGHRYLVMELVSGEDLRARLRRGPLGVERACRILVELAHVLAFIHSRLYVHCDIKADNVRLTDAGVVKLLDFGLMHPLATPAGASIGGTPSYMSPEAITGSMIDGRTDLYSLGVLGFELLAGRPPFAAATVNELLEMHERAPVPRIGDVPARVQTIIDKLMAKRPRDRFQHAGDLLLALDGVAGVSAELATVAQRTSYLTTADLIGRDRDVAILRQRIDDVRAGRARSVFVTAPGGVGKSRLLQEVRLHAKLAGLACGVGYCRGESQEPLRPIAQALAPLIELVPHDVLAMHGSVLAEMFPSLRRRGHVPRAAGKAEMFSAVSACLIALANVTPFVVCVEDLHWADAATIELCSVLVRTLAGKPAVVVGTLRPAEVEPFSLLHYTLHEGDAERLEIEPLAPDDTTALLSSMLEAELPAELTARLHDSTRGNAFFLTEMLRALIEQRQLQLRGGRWHAEPDPDIPRSLEEVVALRLRTLDAGALTLCRKLAPLGRAFSLELAKALGDLTDDALFRHLEELTERQFIQCVDGQYTFVHDTLQDAIYRDTPDAIRRHAHRRIAELLEANAGDNAEHATAIGWHHARAAEPARAIPFLLAAGDRLLARNLLLDATRQYQQAAELLEHSGGDQLLLAWARLVDAATYGDPPAAIRAGERLFAAWEQRLDLPAGARRAAEERRAWRTLATPEANARLEQSYTDRSLRPQSRDPDDILPLLHVYRGRIAASYGSLGQLDRSFALAETNLALTPDPDDPFRASALLSRGMALVQRGEWTRQQAEAREAIDIFERHVHTIGVMPRRLQWFHAEAYYFRLMGQAMMGEALDADAAVRGLELGHRGGFADVCFCLRLTALERAAVTGDPAVESLLPELADALQRLGRPRLLESRLFLLAPMYFVQRRDAARQAAPIDKLESFLAVMDDAFIRLYVMLYRVLVAANAGELDVAERLADQAIVAGRERHFSRLNMLLCTRAELHAARGQRDKAREVAGAALDRARSAELANPFDEAIALRVVGEVTGDVSLLRESLAFSRAHENKLHAGRALLALARALSLSHPDRPAALIEARTIFGELRADAWLAEVERSA